MKRKIGTMLDDKLLQQLKERSVRDNRSMSDILQDALQNYLHNASSHRDLRLAAANRFCSRPFDLSTDDLQQLIDEEYYEQ